MQIATAAGAPADLHLLSAAHACVGHSLGGAIAVIAALEVRRAFPDTPLSLYTVGAPRVGNTAFAGHVSEALPDAWALVNLNDPVRRQTDQRERGRGGFSPCQTWP